MKQKYLRTGAAVAYLFPALSLLVQLILWSVPRLFFISEGKAMDTQSLFGFLERTLETCTATLTASNQSAETLSVARTMQILTILGIVFAVVYALFAIASAALWMLSSALSPDAPLSRAARRGYRFFCANSIVYAVYCFLPVLAASTPFWMLDFYKNTFWMDVSLHFYGPSELLLSCLLAVIPAILMPLTVKDQRRRACGLFYRSKKDKKDNP